MTIMKFEQFSGPEKFELGQFLPERFELRLRHPITMHRASNPMNYRGPMVALYFQLIHSAVSLSSLAILQYNIINNSEQNELLWLRKITCTKIHPSGRLALLLTPMYAFCDNNILLNSTRHYNYS